jgi:hypothetical protein
MPYPNEHACRIRDPDEFQKDSFRRITKGSETGKGPRDGKQLHIIIGRPKGKTTTTTQAYRYPVDDWTESQAREHCKEQSGTFEPASKDSVTVGETREAQGIEAIRERLPEIEGRCVLASEDWADGIENRYIGGEVELRRSRKGIGITGSVPFEVESSGLPFIEIIGRTFFDKSLKDGSDIVSSWNHDPIWVLGRRSNGTLKIGKTDSDLEYDVDLDEDDPMHRHFARRVERRDVIGSSFTFTTIRDEWGETEDNQPLRRLVEGRVFELGPVTYPAYDKSGAQSRAQSLCDVASVKCGDDLDLVEIAQVLWRTKDGLAQVPDDVAVLKEWIKRLASYLPADDFVPAVRLMERQEAMNQVVAKHRLVSTTAATPEQIAEARERVRARLQELS